MNRRAGFTLLEVMVAVTVFALTMGSLITLVTQNLAQLARANLETDAAILAEQRIRELLTEVEGGEPLELGSDAGEFPEPYAMLRWELSVEPWGIPLPEADIERAGSSSVFQSDSDTPGAPEMSLRRVVLRMLREDEEEDLIDPFVVLVLDPAEADEEDEP